MNNVLLISEDYLKTNSALSDNAFGKYCLPAIREAQEMGLKPAIGDLYDKIIGLVADGEIDEEMNKKYKDFLDVYIQPYLLYKTQADIVPILNIKMANIGTVVANTEHIQSLSQGNIDLVQNYFTEKSDFYLREMKNFLKCHLNDFPEFNIKDLDTSTSTGIWLGGERGRISK